MKKSVVLLLRIVRNQVAFHPVVRNVWHRVLSSISRFPKSTKAGKNKK